MNADLSLEPKKLFPTFDLLLCHIEKISVTRTNDQCQTRWQIPEEYLECCNVPSCKQWESRNNSRLYMSCMIIQKTQTRNKLIEENWVMTALLHYIRLHIQMFRQRHAEKILKTKFSKTYTEWHVFYSLCTPGINWLSLFTIDSPCVFSNPLKLQGNASITKTNKKNP